MAIRLPDLSTSGCRVLIVCGITEDRDAVSKIRRLENVAAQFRTGGHTAIVRATFDTKRSSGHFHLEVVDKDYWQRTGAPKPTGRVSDVQAAIEALEGTSLEANIDGFFTVPVADLPPVIRSATEEIRAGDVSVRMTRGTLTVKGAPIEEIEWYARPDSPEALLILHSRRTIRVSPDYLVEALNIVAPAFSVLIQGRPTDAGKDK